MTPLSFLHYLPIHLRLLVLLLIVGSSSLRAATKADADSLYAQGHYAQARKLYEALLKGNGSDADLYYNLGNACFKTDDLPHALLNYERALRLNPSDADVKANLAFVRTQITDKQAPVAEMFFITWWKAAATALPFAAYALIALVAFLLLLIALACTIFLHRDRLRRLSLRLALLCLLCCLLSNLLLITQRQLLRRHDAAIVMDPVLTVKSSPDAQSTDLFILHEGTRVRLLDTTMSQWMEVRLEDGKQGWIPRSAVEII